MNTNLMTMKIHPRWKSTAASHSLHLYILVCIITVILTHPKAGGRFGRPLIVLAERSKPGEGKVEPYSKRKVVSYRRIKCSHSHNSAAGVHQSTNYSHSSQWLMSVKKCHSCIQRHRYVKVLDVAVGLLEVIT